jgi:hypothetical protein
VTRAERKAATRLVLNAIGPAALTWAVEKRATIILAPDWIVVPEGVELAATLIEWVEKVGTATRHSHRFTVYYLSDDIAGWAEQRLQAMGVIR